MTLKEKNRKGIFTEGQLDLAYKFYTKEKQIHHTFEEWLNIFWGVRKINE